MVVEGFGHISGEADAAVGSGVAGQVALVHSDGTVKAQKVKHGCAFIELPGGGLVLAGVRVAVDDLAGSAVFNHAVEAGAVVRVALGDLKAALGGAVRAGAGGDRAHANELSALIKVCFLLCQIDANAGRPAHAIAVPVAASVKRALVKVAIGRGSVTKSGEILAGSAVGGGTGTGRA